MMEIEGHGMQTLQSHSFDGSIISTWFPISYVMVQIVILLPQQRTIYVPIPFRTSFSYIFMHNNFIPAKIVKLFL